ncbi:MAG: hypothetical protein R3B13_11140 [Polyangiaceae bacterium]
MVGPWANLWGGTELEGWPIAIDGVGQLAGATLLTLGFTNSRPVLGPPTARAESRSLHFALGPRQLSMGGAF